MNRKMTTMAECGIPSDRDAAMADRAGRELNALIYAAETVPVRFGATTAVTVAVPTAALRLLREILDQMAHGNGVALAPLHAELPTRQAADFLQVSRTHLVPLLNHGQLPCRKVGAHRRVRAADIAAYRRKTESRRGEASDERTACDQDLGLQ